MIDLNKLAAEIHAAAVEKGFWDVEDAESKHIAKMISELGEIVQADRAGVMYEVEHDGAKPEGVIAEIADYVMMALDLLKHLEADFAVIPEVCADYSGLKQLCANYNAYEVALVLSAKLIAYASKVEDETSGSDLAFTIYIASAWAEAHGYDLWEVILQKIEYNKSRPALHGRLY